MNTLSKVFFPLGAIAALFLAITTQNWWKLSIVALFLIAAIQAYKTPGTSDVNEERDQSGESK